MKNSSFDRWTVVEFDLGEFEHPTLGRYPEYAVKLKTKDGSLLELVLQHPVDSKTMSSCASSWMSPTDRRDAYDSAKRYYYNHRCKEEYRYLINIALRFGHRHEKI